MKSMYRVGDDLFVALAFVSFVVGVVLRLLGINTLFFGITLKEVLFFSTVCLLFSIALSLYDLNARNR